MAVTQTTMLPMVLVKITLAILLILIMVMMMRTMMTLMTRLTRRKRRTSLRLETYLRACHAWCLGEGKRAICERMMRISVHVSVCVHVFMHTRACVRTNCFGRVWHEEMGVVEVRKKVSRG